MKITKKLSIGHWKDNVFMGPLASHEAQEKYFYFQGIAEKERAETLLKAKKLSKEDFDHQFFLVIMSVPVFAWWNLLRHQLIKRQRFLVLM